MKFRNPFKKRMTAAEGLRQFRQLAEDFEIPEAFYTY